MIDGVTLAPLTAHHDERGTFCEVARVSQLPAVPVQLSHSFMHAGVTKAWHFHKQQWDWWYVIHGTLKIVLFDMRFDVTTDFPEHWINAGVDQLGLSSTPGILNEFILRANHPPYILFAPVHGGGGTFERACAEIWKPALLGIPPGVAHGCKALSDCHLIYLTSKEYDGTDEGRIAHDDATIGYDWMEGEEIK